MTRHEIKILHCVKHIITMEGRLNASIDELLDELDLTREEVNDHGNNLKETDT